MATFELQIIEPNPHLRSLLSWHLQQAGYGIFSSGDLSQAKQLFYQRQPKMLILSADFLRVYPIPQDWSFVPGYVSSSQRC